MTGDRSGLTEAEKRAASEGTSSAGGYVVPAPISARVYDLVRARSSVLRSGTTIVPMSSRTLDLVKVTTGPTSSWVAENAQASSADIVVARVQLTAKMLATYAETSLELIADSDPSFLYLGNLDRGRDGDRARSRVPRRYGLEQSTARDPADSCVKPCCEP